MSSCVLPTEVGSAVLSELLAAVEEEAMVEGVVVEGVVIEERGVSGCGHILSRTASGQYSLIWLWRYHCCSRDRPEGETTSGSCCEDGVQVGSISSEKRSISESDSILTSTEPGADSDMERCWNFFICFSLRSRPANMAVQL